MAGGRHCLIFLVLVCALVTEGQFSRRSRGGRRRNRDREPRNHQESSESDVKVCPGGWNHYEDHCYYRPKVSRQTFTKARDVCLLLGGAKLVSINTAGEEEFINDMLNNEPHWLGLSYETSWMWEDGDISLIRALQGTAGPTRCVVIVQSNPWWYFWSWFGNTTIEWFTEPCNEERALICEIHVNDTTWKCEDQWLWWGSGCYNVSSELTTFDQAVTGCPDGGNLTSVLNADENYAMLKLLEASGHTKAWLGLMRDAGVWSWVDSSPVKYTNWHGEYVHPGAVGLRTTGFIFQYTTWWGTPATSFEWLGERSNTNDRYISICKKKILDPLEFPIAQVKAVPNDRQGAYYRATNVFNASLVADGALRLRGKIECAQFCANDYGCKSFHYEKQSKLCVVSRDPTAPITYRMTDALP